MTEIPLTRDITFHADDGCEYIYSLYRNQFKYNHEIETTYSATECSLEGVEASYQNKKVIMGVWVFDEGILSLDLNIYRGTVIVTACGATIANVEKLLVLARTLAPEDEGLVDDTIACQFWRYSTEGPKQSKRDLDALEWADIKDNYPHASGLDHLMTTFKPGIGGQLILMQGLPGVGKTSALRALAYEWRKWAVLHYIVDAETFFGAHADYMMQVLIEDSNKRQPWDFEEEDVIPEEDKWRLIVLEDCGEMLKPDARQEVGQALSRLLNVCDGLIGRGLKFLVLVTTNEDVGKLHEAVSRPGRCAARVEFKPFTIDEANAWLASHGSNEEVTSKQSLADLYAKINHFENQIEEAPMGFR